LLLPDEEMEILRYRGLIEDFNKNIWAYEHHLSQQAPFPEEPHSLIHGKCTPEGT
jgi:hypothetical protein